MQLIEPLMGGVTGAEGGTAEIWNRGDTARARYFWDFEGTKAVYSGLDIELDAYGSAEVYTSLSCLVRVRSQAGAVVRTFVILGVAHADELDADSFTDDTVGEALDTWEPSAGEPDFEVTLNAAPTTLEFIGETTFAQMQTVCAVKSFGAIGDGVTDDSVAIGKAIAFASRGGGTVLFNAGTYSITSTIVVPGTVTLRGTGPGGTVIVQQSHTARIFSVQSATATAYIRGMTIRYASTSGDYSQYGVDILSGSKVQFNNVSFGTAAIPFIRAIAVGRGNLDAFSEVAIESCAIYASSKLYVDFRTTPPDTRPTISKTIMAIVNGTGGASALNYTDTAYVAITSCAFSGCTNGDTYVGFSVITSVTLSDAGVATSENPAWSVSGCSFANPTSGTCQAFGNAIENEGFVCEDQNTFGGSVRFVQINARVPAIAFNSARSRVTRGTEITGYVYPTEHGTHVLSKSSSTTGTLYLYSTARCNQRRIFVHNASGSATVQWAVSYSEAATVGYSQDFPIFAFGLSIANGTTRLLEYISLGGLFTETQFAPIVDGAQVGPLT